MKDGTPQTSRRKYHESPLSSKQEESPAQIKSSKIIKNESAKLIKNSIPYDKNSGSKFTLDVTGSTSNSKLKTSSLNMNKVS